MVLGQLLHHLLHELLEEALPEEVVGLHRGVLELKRTVVVVPVAGQLLEEDQGAPGTVPQLVLGQVARDRVHPGRELLRRIEAVEVTRHPDERLLHEVLGPVPVAGLPGDEVHETVAIALEEELERAVPSIQVGRHELFVREGVERPGHPVVCGRRGSHVSPRLCAACRERFSIRRRSITPVRRMRKFFSNVHF